MLKAYNDKTAQNDTMTVYLPVHWLLEYMEENSNTHTNVDYINYHIHYFTQKHHPLYTVTHISDLLLYEKANIPHYPLWDWMTRTSYPKCSTFLSIHCKCNPKLLTLKINHGSKKLLQVML